MNDINSTTLEQLDLLLNNLGQVFKVQVENIRSTNACNPERALTQIWERLDLDYGSPEAVEHSMKQRIASFTSLTENDRKRYFDLFDLAAEMKSLKGDDSLGSAFAYLDSSTGKNDFIRNLPKRFREKWATKINNKVYHVNFSVFVNLLKDLARLRNDPSMIMDHLPQNPRAHHPPQRKPVQRSDISVHKTCSLESTWI